MESLPKKKKAADRSEMIRNAFPGDPLPVLSQHVEQIVRLPEDADIKLNLYEYGDNDMYEAEVI
jgi:hypothetical protein